MSWIFGAINASDDVLKIKNVLKEAPLYSYISDSISIISGGNPETCFSRHDVVQNKGWLAVGTGIVETGNGFSICDEKIWSELFSQNEINIPKIYGHYVILNWDENNLTIYTDQLGLRDIYISKNGNKIYFSTRIDWIAKFVESQINFETFGSRWLLFNQISTESVLSNIKRLSGGESARIDLSNLSINYFSNDFIPSINDTNEEISIDQFSERLDKLIQVPLFANRKISLSLSGGMDSRVLLSSLIKNVNYDLWDTHTFGNEAHPDFQLSKMITDRYFIKHQGFKREQQSPDIYIEELKEYCAETIVNSSASSISQLNNYLLLSNWKNITIIDGGYGEIWRREFYYRLFVKDKNAVKERNYEKILSHLRLPKADIFAKDINELMWKGSKEQLENIFEKLPAIEKIGVENWLDLLALKARLPNYFGHEQSRIDAIVQTYMPFIQIPLLKDLFQIPINKKKNAKLLREIIKRNSKELSKFSLAKGEITHPFSFSTIESRLWSIAIKKLKRNKPSHNPSAQFLNYIGTFISDTLNSKSVLENGIYDSEKVQTIIDDFHKDPNTAAYELDWLLSFELFRQSIQ